MRWRACPLVLLCPCVSVLTLSASAGTLEDVMSATFKIANEGSTATCFIVALPEDSRSGRKERVLVTAAHVLEQMSGEKCRLVLREKQASGGFARKEVPLKIRSGNQPLWVRHPEIDVAALPLKLADDRTVASLSFDRLASAAAIQSGRLRAADEVWIACYPAQLEANRAGFPILRRGSVASHPLAPLKRHRTYLVDYSTVGGDSGGPVVLGGRRIWHKSDEERSGEGANPRLIVGLVIGQHRQTTKSVSPHEERTVHRSLGLAIVVHAEFIRQTIERLTR